jgi:hypothetical protein
MFLLQYILGIDARDAAAYKKVKRIDSAFHILDGDKTI